MQLQDIRKRAGITQNLVAESLCVDQSAISQWESGITYPHPSKIPKLAKLYDVTEGEIIAACNASREQRQSSA